MKIILMVPEMDVGGVEQGAFDLACGFRKAGLEPIVVSGPGNYIPLLKEKKIKWYNLPTSKKNPWNFIYSFLKLKEILQKEKPDILHCRSRFPAWIGYYASKSFPEVHFVTSIHGFYKKRYYSRILARGERVIVISKALEKYAIKFLKASKDTLRIVHNGVQTELFISLTKKQHKGFVVGGIGRSTKVKGFHYLIEAVKKLHSGIPELKVCLVGQGPYRKFLEDLTVRLNLNNVSFIQGRAWEHLPYFDILVAPHEETESIKEIEDVWPGRVAIEAQLAGIPVITTLNGVKKGEFLETPTTIFVPPRDAATLAKAILHIFENYDRTIKMTQKARQYALQNFTVDTMVDKTLKVYEELL